MSKNSFLPHHFTFPLLSSKKPLFYPLLSSEFGVNLWELRETIQRSIYDIKVSSLSLAFSWFHFVISLVKFPFLRCFSRPYMRAIILAGSPYEACENDAFSQVSLKPPARFSHCANGAPVRTAKPNFFFKF
jgi:hypothetical protein